MRCSGGPTTHSDRLEALSDGAERPFVALEESSGDRKFGVMAATTTVDGNRNIAVGAMPSLSRRISL